MRKLIVEAFFLLLLAGGVTFLAANGTYSVPGKWYGFVTDSSDLRKGTNITAEEIKKAVAGGAKYTLINGLFFRAITLSPAEKVAPYAGQSVFVSGAITTNSLLKGANYVPDSDGGGGSFTIAVSSIEPHTAEKDAWYMNCVKNLGYDYCGNNKPLP